MGPSSEEKLGSPGCCELAPLVVKEARWACGEEPPLGLLTIISGDVMREGGGGGGGGGGVAWPALSPAPPMLLCWLVKDGRRLEAGVNMSENVPRMLRPAPLA